MSAEVIDFAEAVALADVKIAKRWIELACTQMARANENVESCLEMARHWAERARVHNERLDAWAAVAEAAGRSFAAELDAEDARACVEDSASWFREGEVGT